MKKFEYIGVTLAAIGFTMLSLGYLFAGFMTGFVSCVFLIIYFNHFKMNGLLALQFYFLCANIYGIFNNL